jgi:hypothetical protein
MDFYRAHAADADPLVLSPMGYITKLAHSYRSLFDHAWNAVRDYRDYDSSGAIGVGVHEARHWHRRAYGGLVFIQSHHTFADIF